MSYVEQSQISAITPKSAEHNEWLYFNCLMITGWTFFNHPIRVKVSQVEVSAEQSIWVLFNQHKKTADTDSVSI